jgi:hypothetical protein
MTKPLAPEVKAAKKASKPVPKPPPAPKKPVMKPARPDQPLTRGLASPFGMDD